MSGTEGAATPALLGTVEFPAVLERVAAHAAGPLGAARVRARTPGTDADVIRAALAQVSELAALLLADDALRAEPVPDIAPALTLLDVAGSVLDGPALADVGRALAAARVVAGELARLERTAPRVAALRAAPPPRALEMRLTTALGPEGDVLDAASPALARARRAVRDARDRLVARLESLLAGLDPTERAADAGVTIREGRYVIPVRSTARARVGGIVHDESATRATVFVEPPEAIELGNELRHREADEQREVLRVLRELTDLLRPQHAAVAAAWEMCIAFDDCCARARYAVEVNGFAPAVGEGPLAIHGARHPLLVAGAGVVVPFDLTLAPDEFCVLVSGPNTGGKSVLIKAVALLSLMAQSGIIPPIGPESSLPLVRRFFADIGDRQSIAASLSTFSAHVAALREILDGAGPGSLVLLDEVGSGTDPAEGAALAGAVLRSLARRHAVTLATTHLGALKRLAAETVGIVNASLQFDAETLSPTYRLLKGVPGRSYGLAIARRLGVAGEILAEAERAVPDAERALDALLAAVEARARDLDARTAAVEETAARQQEAAAAQEERARALATRERDVVARERTLDDAARARAREYLLEARKTVERALGQARAAVDEATAREARRIVEAAIGEYRETGSGKRETSAPLAVGDAVRTPTGSVGTVREIRAAGDVVVEVGSVRLVVDGATLEPLASVPLHPAPPRSLGRPGPPSAVVGHPASQLDLRGLRPDDAEAALVRALDDAVLADLPRLRVIHGKGTGALRDRVRAVLEREARVTSFAPAPPNQGGDGVTIVALGA